MRPADAYRCAEGWCENVTAWPNPLAVVAVVVLVWLVWRVTRD
jgi:hypothetical protein